MTRYAAIVADPPWSQQAGPPMPAREAAWRHRTDLRSRPLAYPTMTVAEIAALPVRDVAAEDAHLYLWTTNRYLPAAFEVVRAWGFTYSSTQVWGKRLMGGGLGGTFRINTEFFIFATRGRVRARDAVRGTWFDWGADLEGDAGTLFGWKRPYDERGKPRHSGKPPEFFDVVRRVSHGPFLELFAREERAGWDRWGNEVACSIELGVAS